MARWVFLLALMLFLGAFARDRFDVWVDATELPTLTLETSAEVRAADGRLLRAYQVEDGLWRLRTTTVDPGFIQMLIAYEDQRFHHHVGVDLRAALRASLGCEVYRFCPTSESILSIPSLEFQQYHERKARTPANSSPAQ